MMSIFVLSACNFSVNDDNEKEALQLQVTQLDQESGLTVDNSEIYQELNLLVNDNPEWGEANDFSVQTVNTLNEGQESAQLMMLAINRLGESIKNVSFNFSLGNTSGDMVWENEPVFIDENTAGVLHNDSSLPVLLPVSPEQTHLLNTLNQENVVMDFSEFSYEVVE